MTTTVKVKTHGWPVRVTTTDRYQTADSGVLHVETKDVAPWSESDFYMTNTRSLAFEELSEWDGKPAPVPMPEPSTD